MSYFKFQSIYTVIDIGTTKICVIIAQKNSNEQFDTGIEEIDSLQRQLTTNIAEFGIVSEDGTQLISDNGFPVVHDGFVFSDQTGEAFEDNEELQIESNNIIDWTDSDPFSEHGRF